MKHASLLVVLALVSSGVLTALVSTTPGVGAIDLTDQPVTVRTNTNVKESLSVCAADDGRIYVVWAERVSGFSDIFMSYSSNNGTTFSPAIRVNQNSSGTQQNPEAATSGNTLYVVWEDKRLDGGDIMLSRSDDGGITFEEMHVSDHEEGTQSHPGLAVNGDNVAVVWEEYRSDNTIRIWNGASGSLVRELAGHQGAVKAVEFSPNGTYLASGSEDSLVKIWSASTGALVMDLTDHTAAVNGVNWSADGSMLATGSWDHNVTIFNTTDFSMITKLNSTGGQLTRNYVNKMAFSPDSSQIAVAYNGRYGTGTPTGSPTNSFNLTVWNMSDYSSWTVLEGANGHTDSVMDVSFSHDGSMLASGSKDNTLAIWNPDSGAMLNNVNLVYDVLSVAWSPDDTHVAGGLANGSIVVINVSDINDRLWLHGKHTGRVNSMDWSVVSDEIASGASDPTAKVWHNVFNIERLNITGHLNSVYSIDWSSNGLSIVTAGGTSGEYGMGENQIFSSISHDNGDTFTSPVLASDSCAKNRLRPKAAMDASGKVSAVWYDSRNGGEDVYFTNSTDGLVFGMNKVLAGNLFVDETIPDIFVQDDGTAHVVWQYDGGARVEYANSSDNFATVKTFSTSSQLPHVAGAGDGSEIYVSWRKKDTATQHNYTWTALSTDNGVTFGNNTIVNFSSTFIGEHSIYVDTYGQMSVAWEMNEGVSENVYYRTTVLEDDYGPRAISSDPEDGATGVSIFSSFSITFSEPMNRVSVETALSWTNGTETWHVGDCVDNQGLWNQYSDTVTFTPEVPFRYLQTSGYSVTIGTGATDRAGNSLVASFSFTFTLSADIDPPSIEHYPSQLTVSYDKQYTAMAIVKDQWGTVDSVRLYYKGVDDISPTNSVLMSLTYTDTYVTSIPAQLSLGNITYYIEATDAFNNKAQVPVNYSNEPYTVQVIDGVKPEISHVQILEQEVFQAAEVWAVVTDGIELQSVEINYRPVGSSAYINEDMSPVANGTPNTFNFTLPAQIAIGQVLYNITALDTSGNFNSTTVFHVQVNDHTVPIINSVIPEYLENETKVRVLANVTDNIDVETVTLYFKAVGSDHWVPRTMVNVGGDVYEYVIPAQRNSGVIYYYVNATDSSGNLASTLTEQDQFEIEVVGVGDDYTLYYILGAVLAVLMVLLVFLLIRRFSREPIVPEEIEQTPQPAEPRETELPEESMTNED